MMMNNKEASIVLWFIFIMLLLLGSIIIIKAITSTSNNWLMYLSSSASFAIALLIVMYVIKTRNQLNIMSLQLNEMRKDRELQNKPLPWPMSLIVTSHKPRLFYDLDKIFEVCSQHKIKFELKNIGTSPGVAIDVCTFMIIPNKKNRMRLSSASIRIDVLEKNQKFPSTEEESESFLFSDYSKSRFFINLLSNNLTELPLVELHIFFKNILGACFHINKLYRLYPKGEDIEIIKTWIERLIRHKESFGLLINYKKSSDSRADELFEELKQKCSEGLEIDEIQYFAWPIPA
jgi:hypothetical protein